MQNFVMSAGVNVPGLFFTPRGLYVEQTTQSPLLIMRQVQLLCLFVNFQRSSCLAAAYPVQCSFIDADITVIWELHQHLLACRDLFARTEHHDRVVWIAKKV